MAKSRGRAKQEFGGLNSGTLARVKNLTDITRKHKQDDNNPAAIDFANGELVITDKLSDQAVKYQLTAAVWKNVEVENR